MNFLAQLFVGIFLAVVAAFLAPRPPKPEPGKLGDIPRTEEGADIPRIYGTVWIKSPNVVWYGDFDTVAIKG